MDPGWTLLGNLLILLAAALLLGTVAEQLRQSAIVGFLLAGTLVGPNGLRWVNEPRDVEVIAELGIALLLFTIGLEFSFARLRRLGAVALVGGTLQVLLTGALAAAAVWAGWRYGFARPLGARAAVAVGAMVALSSTACVLRLLSDKAAVDSPHGRGAMGILLLQDAAVLPLTLLVGALAVGGTPAEVGLNLGKTLLFAAGLVGVLVLLFVYVVPRLLNLPRWAANREFPILLAILLAAGSAYAAHAVGISPAMGAFVAGVLMAESPFAVQVRADVAGFRTVLVTLFFAAVGMLGDPAWAAANFPLVLAAVAAVLVGKTAVVWGLLRLLAFPTGVALAAGLCLAQVGEFSFVLARIAHEGNLIDRDLFRLVVTTTILTLLVTPYLVAAAPALGAMAAGRSKPQPPDPAPDVPTFAGRIVIVGFGPAGQRVAEALLRRHRERLSVIDLNPRGANVARGYGVPPEHVHVGNAAQPEVLEHAGVRDAAVVVLTLPDPDSARQVIHLCRHLNPAVKLVVRSRYHVTRFELELAGADVVVDEEAHVGHRLAAEARRTLGAA